MNKTVRALGVPMVALFALLGADVAPAALGMAAGERVYRVTSRILPARSA
jgi:hypothetical protein